MLQYQHSQNYNVQLNYYHAVLSMFARYLRLGSWKRRVTESCERNLHTSRASSL